MKKFGKRIRVVVVCNGNLDIRQLVEQLALLKGMLVIRDDALILPIEISRSIGPYCARKNEDFVFLDTREFSYERPSKASCASSHSQFYHHETRGIERCIMFAISPCVLFTHIASV